VGRASAFSFLNSAGKSPGCGRGFFAFLRAFLRGALENVRFLDGVFVVKMWWIRGESWSIEPS
jgi:hypothetical protein